MKFFYTSSEEKIKTKVKIANQLLSYSVGDTTRGDDLENSIIDLFSEINGSNSAPIFEDEFKNKELNVLIIPEGSMNFFPMELLPMRFESDTTKYFYYGEFANITYAPSLSSFVEFSKKKGKDKSKKKALLVSANPESESTANYIDNLFVMRSDYGNIENVDNEINSINATMSKRKLLKKGISTTVFDSKDISETQFKATDLGEYKYIHIAAHGVHDDENPKYSGLLLGRDENDNEDGILQAHEIFPLNLNADLVTLSSCFSGFGEIDPNEGNLGIYRTFLIAGAKSVIISLWNVEDKSTALLFSKFYEYLKEGHPKAKSLRLAKMYLKNETRFSHPFYWAPFILMGEA
jgi:CHAT domain-containing protein